MKGAIRNAMKKVGRSVTVKNYTRTGEDDYGPDYDLANPTTHEDVDAIVDPIQQPTGEADAFGVDVGVTRKIQLLEGTDATDSLRDGGGDGASRITIDGSEWIVLLAENTGNGIIEITASRAM